MNQDLFKGYTRKKSLIESALDCALLPGTTPPTQHVESLQLHGTISAALGGSGFPSSGTTQLGYQHFLVWNHRDSITPQSSPALASR